MGKIDVKIPHKLTDTEALARVREIIADLETRYGDTIGPVTQEWEGHEGRFGFKAKGFTIKGKIYVGVDTVRLSSELPFILSLYRAKIAHTIETKGQELLAD
jgi:hypothetical protein